MNLKDNELALTTEVDKSKPKYNMNKKQGFKGNYRICGKYGHKAADCWENKRKQGQESEETF